ncbi:hydroxyacylglutathione hydrolase [Pullulanibacillus camelliae]|uniref:Hydroxyacylglutathione hydrolase n=1 Tax=Pullulanibacillus camelliae TaxID=1707096 RepID=A0A8J2YJP3_9BACL|nr:MBL fold metallo-hydrolase [Pullulanibacillus camelliae]GGE46780.1 hydroxyacylglutathione hydrolase [Pullulanibacillus camelliae]
MQWKRMPLGPLQTNAYILTNESKEALIIDPGEEPQAIFQYIEECGAQPLAILLTHAHFDHIGALETVRTKYTIPVYLHENEADWLSNPDKNGSAHFPMVSACHCQPAERIIIGEQQALVIGGFEFTIFETPGHSPGSVSFYFPDDHVIFSGDVLFKGSVGRTDLYGGDQLTLFESIENKLLPLPEKTRVAPGHGFETTIGEEQAMNPFLT